MDDVNLIWEAYNTNTPIVDNKPTRTVILEQSMTTLAQLITALEEMTSRPIVEAKAPDGHKWQQAWNNIIKDPRYSKLPRQWPGKEAVLGYLSQMGVAHEISKYN